MLLALLLAVQLGQVQESVTVEVVEVPVYVSRHNAPVTGLTREQFELFVDGKPQPIDYFEVMDVREAAPAPGIVDRRQRRLFLLLFDLEFSSPHQVERGRRAALQLIERSSPTDVFSVATFTANRGVEITAPFGADVRTVVRGLRARRVVRTDNFMSQGPVGPIDSGRRYESTPSATVDGLENGPSERLGELLLSDFAEAAKSLATMEGQKHLVVFSAGPPLTYSNSHSMELLLGMDKTFQRANAFLHTVDIAGLRHGFEGGAANTLHTLARGTGGMFLHNSNDFGRLMKEIDDVHRHAYVLGFTPRTAKKGHRTIEVRVRGVDRATVAHRRGF